MQVKSMHVTVYESDGRKWHSKDIIHPSWDQIESAIRKLDKFCHPFLWLFLTDSPEAAELADLNIMGGEGDYWIDFQSETYYLNETGTDDKINIWTSDQGFSASDTRVCHDLETVVSIAKYFCEYGKHDPSVMWTNKRI